MGKFDVEIFKAYGKERSWFQDLLEDRGIPFYIEQEILWSGSYRTPRCEEVQCFYVNCAYQASLQEDIDAYNNLDNLTQEAQAEMDSQPDEMPQVTCPNCGKSYDLDYPKCPYCKHKA